MTKEERAVIRAAMRWQKFYADVDPEALGGGFGRELVLLAKACARLRARLAKGKK